MRDAVIQQKNLPPPNQNRKMATNVTAPELEIPNDKVLAHAARIAINEDKPILLDYFSDTKAGTAFIGEDSNTKEKMLVRSEEEYTSPISKIFKVGDAFIVITENSIYIVSGNIKKKTISTPTA